MNKKLRIEEIIEGHNRNTEKLAEEVRNYVQDPEHSLDNRWSLFIKSGLGINEDSKRRD